MWFEGIVRAGGIAYKYQVKAYMEGSAYGIGGGRISKLTLHRGSLQVAAYDRGWDQAPVDAKAQAAVDSLVNSYGLPGAEA